MSEAGPGDESSGAPVPEMRVLGYHQTRPHLRLLRLPEETIEPAPVALNARNALDRGFMREGWIAFNPNEEVWGVPVPLEGRSFRVGGWWDCVPSIDPRRVWLGSPVSPDPGSTRDRSEPAVVAEYDGADRQVVRRVELEPQLGLQAAVDGGLVVSDGLGRLSLVEPQSQRTTKLTESARDVLVRHRSILALRTAELELTLLDPRTGTETPLRRPLPGEWSTEGSFSPDGRWLAIDIEEQVPPTDPDEVVAALGKPRWTRLALIETGSGSVTLARGRFENFASVAVWSADGEWLVFDAPFDKSLFACQVSAPGPSLVPIVRRRGRVSPLVDVTAIVKA